MMEEGVVIVLVVFGVGFMLVVLFLLKFLRIFVER